jgi:DNA-binding PadR family transcriptional regulator
MDDARDPHALLPLPPASYQVLLALAGTERHGYAIMQEVARASDGRIRLRSGTLYRSIHQMLQAGLIAEADARPDPALDDDRRRYYRLTAFGECVAQAESRRLAALLEQARAKRRVRCEEASMNHAAPRSVMLAVLAYRWLLHLYPHSFQRRFADEMIQVFRATCHESWRHGGGWGLLALTLATALDVAVTATREHMTRGRRDWGEVMAPGA